MFSQTAKKRIIYTSLSILLVKCIKNLLQTKPKRKLPSKRTKNISIAKNSFKIPIKANINKNTNNRFNIIHPSLINLDINQIKYMIEQDKKGFQYINPSFNWSKPAKQLYYKKIKNKSWATYSNAYKSNFIDLRRENYAKNKYNPIT